MKQKLKHTQNIEENLNKFASCVRAGALRMKKKFGSLIYIMHGV
jgi:hypothetical protein